MTAPAFGGRPWRRLVAAVLKRDGHTCAYCRGRATTADHIVPRSRGGPNTMDNLRAACRPCNLRRGNRPPEYLRERLRARRPSYGARTRVTLNGDYTRAEP